VALDRSDLAELNQRRAELGLAQLTSEQVAVLTDNRCPQAAIELLDDMELIGLNRFFIARMKLAYVAGT
jgi:hypothetical protein